MIENKSQKVVAVLDSIDIEAELDPFQAMLESLYIYGVLLQLQRYGDIDYRDCATMRVHEKKQLDNHVAGSAPRHQVMQICTATRTQFLFAARAQLKGQTFSIAYRFYDPTSNQFELCNGQAEAKLGGTVHAPETIDAKAFNLLIDDTAFAILKTVLPQSHSLPRQELSPLTAHVGALRSLLQAHWSPDSSDKVVSLQQAIQQDNQLEQAYSQLGRIYRGKGDHAKSILCYRNALQVTAANARVRAGYATEGGIACVLLGKDELAIQWWNQAITYDPSYLPPYLDLGNLYEDQNELDQAAEYFRQGAELAPTDFRTCSSLARIYSKQGKWAKALDQYQQQLISDGEDAWCHSDIATCHLNLGNAAEASLHLTRTVELDPDGEAGQYAALILGGITASQEV